MKILQKLPYKLKTALPILALAGASMVPASCSNDDDEKDLKHDVELEWFNMYYDEITEINIAKHIKDPMVNNIYLKYLNKGALYTDYSGSTLHMLREALERRIILDPERVRGRGNLVFTPGECWKSDSLWFVEKGWTVNTPYAPKQR